MATGKYIVERTRIAVNCVAVLAEFVCASILPAFSGVEARADEIANAEYDRLGSNGEDDMSAVADAAREAAEEFYDKMMAVRQLSLNLYAAGLFHLLEQQLASIGQEVAHGAPGVDPPADTNLTAVAAWYKSYLGIDVCQLVHWKKVEELCYLANVVKHGEGRSAKQLSGLNPKLFEHPVYGDIFSSGWISAQPIRSPLFGEDLYVTEESFKDYALNCCGLLQEVIAHFEAVKDVFYPRTG